MSAPLAAASAALGRLLAPVAGDHLGGSDRSGVVRARDGATTVVVKSYAGGVRTSWARERIGLSVAGQLGLAPRLLAVADDPPLVVMEDLGSAPSVADHLLGSDREAADTAMHAWATALGSLHARAYADREATRSAMAAAVEEAVATATEPRDRFHAGVTRSLDQASVDWARHAEVLGLSEPSPNVRALADSLAGHEHDTLTPADVCPDNNLLLPDGCRLIDFEWSEVRHPAWDAAYLTVPWPTCWCSWRVPDDVGARTLETYRAVAAESIPHVTADAFDADVEAARVCWALVTVSWWLLRVLEADPVQGPGAPLARPRTQHRLALVAQSRTSAAAFAGEVLEHTRERWGDLALELAPAYR